MKKALLILDAQNGFLTYKNFENEMNNIKNLVEVFKANKDIIISTRHIDKNEKSMIFTDSIGGQIDEFIKENSDFTIEKTIPNAFIETNLQQILNENEITEVIVVGFNTEYCALFNTIALHDRGFKAIYIEDAIGTVNDEETYEMPGLDINDFISTVLHWSGVVEVDDLEEYL